MRLRPDFRGGNLETHRAIADREHGGFLNHAATQAEVDSTFANCFDRAVLANKRGETGGEAAPWADCSYGKCVFRSVTVWQLALPGRMKY